VKEPILAEAAPTRLIQHIELAVEDIGRAAGNIHQELSRRPSSS
jgi:hypothetical protein